MGDSEDDFKRKQDSKVENLSNKKVVIVGGGEIGGTFKELFANAGVQVDVIDPFLSVNDDSVFAEWCNYSDSNNLDEVDYVLVATKTCHFEDVLRRMPKELFSKLVFVQNGLNVPELGSKIDETISDTNGAIYAVLNFSKKPGHRAVVAKSSAFYGEDQNRMDELVQLLNKGAGASDDLDYSKDGECDFAMRLDKDLFLKGKLMKGIVNVVFNSLCTISVRNVRDTWEHFGEDFIREMTKEILMAFNAYYEGVNIDEEEAMNLLRKISVDWGDEIPTTFIDFWGKLPPMARKPSKYEVLSTALSETVVQSETDSLLGFVMQIAKEKGFESHMNKCGIVHKEMLDIESNINDIKRGIRQYMYMKFIGWPKPL